MGARDFEIRIDAARPLAVLRNGGRRMQYAIVNGLNDTAKDVQKAARERVTSTLTVRKSEFIKRQAAIIDFASVSGKRFQARIAVGQKERLLLSLLEAGGERKSFGGGRRVAVPRTGGPARPDFAQPVPAALRIRALRLIKVVAGQVMRTKKGRSRRERRDVTFKAHVTSTGKVQIKGRQRTFVLTSTAKAPEGGIYQRVGPGPDDIRLIYPFVQSPALKPILRWIETAKRTAGHHFASNLNRRVRAEWSRALGLNLG